MNEAVENIGARRLQTVMEKLLEDVSFDAEDRSGETLSSTRPSSSGSSPASPRTPTSAATCFSLVAHRERWNGLSIRLQPPIAAGSLSSQFNWETTYVFETESSYSCRGDRVRIAGVGPGPAVDDDYPNDDHANSADHDAACDHDTTTPDQPTTTPDGQPATTTQTTTTQTQPTTTPTEPAGCDDDPNHDDRDAGNRGNGGRHQGAASRSTTRVEQLVGKVDSVKGEGAIVNTGKARAEIPLASFGKNDKGLVVSVTKADLNSKAKKTETTTTTKTKTKPEPRPSSWAIERFAVAPDEALDEGRPQARPHAGKAEAAGRPGVAGLERVGPCRLPSRRRRERP